MQVYLIMLLVILADTIHPPIVAILGVVYFAWMASGWAGQDFCNSNFSLRYYRLPSAIALYFCQKLLQRYVLHQTPDKSSKPLFVLVATASIVASILFFSRAREHDVWRQLGLPDCQLICKSCTPSCQGDLRSLLCAFPLQIALLCFCNLQVHLSGSLSWLLRFISKLCVPIQLLHRIVYHVAGRHFSYAATGDRHTGFKWRLGLVERQLFHELPLLVLNIIAALTINTFVVEPWVEFVREADRWPRASQLMSLAYFILCISTWLGCSNLLWTDMRGSWC